MKQLLQKHNIDIVAISESKRDDDHPVINIHPDYAWIGKNRSTGKGGGVGFMLNKNSVSVTDGILLNSMDDEFERLWMSIKVLDTTIALGVVYFPVDNLGDRAEDAQRLHYELIQNVGTLENKFDKVLLVGDFNGKIKSCRDPSRPSSNGQLLDHMVDVTELVVLNESSKCSGSITWSRGQQTSTIDYVLCSTPMYDITKSLCIDESQQYSLGSDHNFLLVDVLLESRKKPLHDDKCEVLKWNIKNDTDWTAFQSEIKERLANWDCEKYSNVDNMWHDLKHIITKAGERSIGYKQYKSKREYWDKEVENLIKDRRQANKLYRIWSKKPNCSPELLHILWEDYLEKKKMVSNKVKYNEYARKVKLINENAAKATSNPRAFWKMLKRLNQSNDYPIRIQDPDDPSVIIDDPLKIREKLTKYWSNLGNTNKPDEEELIKNLDTLQASRVVSFCDLQ